MKLNNTCGTSVLTSWLALLVAFAVSIHPVLSFASGGSSSGGGSGSGSGSGGGGTTAQVDSINVSKCYYASTGQLLIKASSSDTAAHLYVYLPSGAYLCEVQNGGGSRYGGTVTPYIGFDPGSVTIKSSSGGSITVPTAPFQI